MAAPPVSPPSNKGRADGARVPSAPDGLGPSLRDSSGLDHALLGNGCRRLDGTTDTARMGETESGEHQQDGRSTKLTIAPMPAIVATVPNA